MRAAEQLPQRFTQRLPLLGWQPVRAGHRGGIARAAQRLAQFRLALLGQMRNLFDRKLYQLRLQLGPGQLREQPTQENERV